MVCNRRGVALVLVLWIMLALIILAAGIAVMSRTETQIAHNYSDTIRCRWAARAGVFSAIENIKTLNQQTMTYLGEEPDPVESTELNLELDGYAFEATIEDETGKVNLNAAPPETLAALLGSTELADCIIDWRDTDDTPGAQGAETEYYSTLDPPYRCRNSAFQTPGELLLVKGITADVLAAAPADGARPIGQLISVFGPTAQAETTGTAGAVKVDIQSASRRALRNRLGDVLSDEEIRAIIRYRRDTAFRQPAEIVRVPGLSRLKIEQIYDRLRVAGAETPATTLNVNTAAVEALSVQPGLDSVTAQAIVDYRASQGAFPSVGGLLAVSDVNDDIFVASARYLSVKSTVFKIVSRGVCEASGASATINCVVELDSSGAAKTRYWQE